MFLNSHEIVDGVGNEVIVVFTLVNVLVLIVAFFSCVWLRNNMNSDNSQWLIRRSSAQGSPIGNETVNAPDVGVRDPNVLGQQCPVCLNEVTYPIETNCGHIFCSRCMIEYWRRGNWPQAVLCPLCRQRVSVLLRCFSSGPEGSSQREIVNRINYDVNEYNRRFASGPIPWIQYILDLPVLLRHAVSDLFSFQGMINMIRFRIIMCIILGIIYVVSPLDIIPEAIFGLFGFIDDVLVILLISIYISLIYRAFLSRMWENT